LENIKEIAATAAIRITMTSDPSNIGVVRTAVEAFGDRHGFTRSQSDQIGLAVNEALANVIEHAYGGDVTRPIQISMAVAETGPEARTALKLVIRDYGRHVDPECIKSRKLDEIRPGGLGVHIIKTVMDDVRYCCVPEGGMELTMIKFVDSTKEVQA
jgi:anti-sigma regulatory factor (Ser/Thr protein kinase)